MQPTLVITVGGEDFPFDPPSVQEVRAVKKWTGGEFTSRKQWFSAALREDGDALLACYVTMKRRQGALLSFDDATDFPSDVTAKFVDGDGREVEQVLQVKDDGSVIIVDGDVVPVLDEEGNPQWRDAESGTVIPFDRTPKTTSVSTEQPSNGGGTEGGTRSIAAV